MSRQCCTRVFALGLVIALACIITNCTWATDQQEKNARFEAFDLLYNQNELDDALAVLDEIARDYPDVDWRIPYWRGMCYHDLGKFTEALSNYTEALRIATEVSDRAHILQTRIQIATVNIDNGMPDEAERMCMELLTEYPEAAAKLYSIIGRICIDQKRYSEAESALKAGMGKAASQDDKKLVFEGMQRLTDCYIDEGMYEKAESLCYVLLQNFPEASAEWYSRIGRIYMDQKMYTEAEIALKAGYEKATLPNDKRLMLEGMERLINCYIDEEMYSKGENVCSGLLNDYPEDVAKWSSMLAQIYMVQKKNSQAESILKSGLEKATLPKDKDQVVWMKFQLGEAYKNSGKTSDALAFYKQLETEELERNDLVKLMIASCYRDLGKYDEAIAINREVAVTNAPASNEAKIQVAECLARQGKLDEAIAELDDIALHYPDLKITSLLRKAEIFLGAYSLNQKDYDRAIMVLEECTSLDPEEKTAKEFLFSALKGAKRFNEAEDLMRSIIESDGNSERKADHLNDLGLVCQIGQKYNEAIQVYEEEANIALNVDVKGRALYYAACCYRELGNDTKASQVFEKVVSECAETHWAQLAQNGLASL